MSGVSFALPWVGVLLLLVALLALWRQRAARANAAAVRALAGAVATPPHAVRAWLLYAALALAVLGAMQPLWGTRTDELERRGRDVVVLLDVSQSMQAIEAGESRAARARQALSTLLDAVEADAHHRLSLITFAGRAQLVVPLTADYRLFRERLEAFDPRQVPRPGSHLGYALRQALHGFGGLTRDYSDIVVISDGEDHGSAPLRAAATAAGAGVRVHTFAIGDAQHGAPVPAFGAPDRVLSHAGSPVVSRMNPRLMARIAQRGNGTYLAAGGDPSRVVNLLRQQIDTAPRRVLSRVEATGEAHRASWLVLLALLLVCIEMLLPVGVSPTRRATRLAPVSSLVLVCALALTGFRLVTPVATQVVDANAAYARGDYAGAAGAYLAALDVLEAGAADTPLGDAVRVRYNLGSAQFKQFAYLDAFTQFSESLDSDDRDVALRARYNLGNVRYQQALSAMQTFRDAVTPTRDAIEWFRAALEIDPGFADARYNLELALLLLRALEAEAQVIDNAPDAGSRAGSSGLTKQFESSGVQGADDTPSRAEDSDESDVQPDAQATRGNAKDQAQPARRGDASAGRPDEMSVEDAQALVELTRANADETLASRMQWRAARMRDSAVARNW